MLANFDNYITARVTKPCPIIPIAQQTCLYQET